MLNHRIRLLSMKNLLLIIPLLFGCSSNVISALTDMFITPIVYSDYGNCSQYINRYNELQDEKKNLNVEYEEQMNNNLSDAQKQEFDDRILDLSFQVNNSLQNWQDCSAHHNNQPR